MGNVEAGGNDQVVRLLTGGDEDSMEAHDRHTIVYTTDAGYWEHTYAALYSLLVNNQRLALDVHVLCESRNPSFEHARSLLVECHPNVRVEIIEIDPRRFSNAPTARYFTVANFYRLAIGSLLPATARRALYLDGDTIVRGSLEGLLTIEVEDAVLAAARVDAPQQTEYATEAERLGLPAGTPYFNSGVLLINLDRWRGGNYEQRCMDYIVANRDRPERFEFVDQDVLNAVLVGQWKALPQRFNVTEWTQTVASETSRRTRGAEMEPAIVHFAGSSKPWHGACRHPYEFEYWHYRQQTPYANRRLRMKCRLICLVRKLPWADRIFDVLRLTRRLGRAARAAGTYARGGPVAGK